MQISLQKSAKYSPKYFFEICQSLRNRNRPKNIIQHCMKRIRTSSEILNENIQRKNSTFLVNSSEGNKNYTVEFGSSEKFPKCTCIDFSRYFLPRKHIMFAVINQYDDVSWETLPKWYSESVHMTLDNNLVVSVKVSSKENNLLSSTEDVAATQ